MDNICKICNSEFFERSHFWKTHKIKEKDSDEIKYENYKKIITNNLDKMYYGIDFVRDLDIVDIQEAKYAMIRKIKERNEEKENYYTDFITSKVKNKKWLNKQTIYKIHKTPTKTKQDQETHYKASKIITKLATNISILFFTRYHELLFHPRILHALAT